MARWLQHDPSGADRSIHLPTSCPPVCGSRRFRKRAFYSTALSLNQRTNFGKVDNPRFSLASRMFIVVGSLMARGSGRPNEIHALPGVSRVKKPKRRPCQGSNRPCREPCVQARLALPPLRQERTLITHHQPDGRKSRNDRRIFFRAFRWRLLGSQTRRKLLAAFSRSAFHSCSCQPFLTGGECAFQIGQVSVHPLQHRYEFLRLSFG